MVIFDTNILIELYRGNIAVKEHILKISSTDIFRYHTLGNRTGIADSLIAATALYHQLPLYTLNKKHFQFIPGIQLI